MQRLAHSHINNVRNISNFRKLVYLRNDFRNIKITNQNQKKSKENNKYNSIKFKPNNFGYLASKIHFEKLSKLKISNSDKLIEYFGIKNSDDMNNKIDLYLSQ